MSTKSTVPVEEYLRMSFDGPDPEYLDGELLERNLGETPHSKTQCNLIVVFHDELRKKTGFCVLPELHLRISPTRYRIADIAVFLEEPSERIPSRPPFLTIEIISEGDRFKEIREKCEEYLAWGVRHIWLVDPAARELWVFDDAGLRRVPAFEVPEFTITPEQIFG